jgi:hypothetical protein
MKNRFGCFTGTGLIAALVTFLLVGGIALARGGILFSPGALNAQAGTPLGGVISHADTGGKCGSCHTAFWEQATMTDRCTTCHTDVLTQMQNPATLHGSLSKNNPGLSCRACHPDHRGPNAPLTVISNINFPHDTVGFALTAHRTNADGSPFICNDCHSQGYIHFNPQVCSTCHQQIKAVFMQIHVQAYGTSCLGCHDGVETYGRHFDHSLVAFQLTGKHSQTDCVQCHSGARSIADMRTTPQACSACHTKNDAHLGSLGSDCGACHTTTAWKPSTFDHNLAVFKLTGKHVAVACAQCHKDMNFKSTPSECVACHAKDDAHQGSLGSDCAACHTTSAWKPSTFDHNLAAFKLTGKHVTVACTQCHSDLNFKNTPTTCYACHAKNDTHKGQFGQDCGLCHTTSAWLPSTFDHNKFFPLTGAHAGLACTQCHLGGNFTNASTACAGCHADPAWHAGAFGGGCSSCHNTSAWIPASFNQAHPGGCGEGGCVNHGGASCKDCHTVNVSTSTCIKCHSGNPGGDGGGGGGAMIFPFGVDLRVVIRFAASRLNTLSPSVELLKQ